MTGLGKTWPRSCERCFFGKTQFTNYGEFLFFP